MLSDVNWIDVAILFHKNIWSFTYELAINIKNSTFLCLWPGETKGQKQIDDNRGVIWCSKNQIQRLDLKTNDKALALSLWYVWATIFFFFEMIA